MAKTRSINTKFWKDSYIRDLEPNEKLIFLYLISNPATNISGIYEITLEEIVFDTGIDYDSVSKAIHRLSTDKKIIYQDNWLIIINFIRHQSLNPKVRIGIEESIKQCPKWLKDRLSIDYDSLCIGFDAFNLNLNLNLNSNSNPDGDAQAQPVDEEDEKNFQFLRDKKKLNVLKNETDWLSVFVRCEKEQIDFQTFYLWLDESRDKEKSSTVSANMMLSDSWITSFKNRSIIPAKTSFISSQLTPYSYPKREDRNA